MRFTFRASESGGLGPNRNSFPREKKAPVHVIGTGYSPACELQPSVRDGRVITDVTG
jgi:hypothetical protein